jgi:hypothetical protein
MVERREVEFDVGGGDHLRGWRARAFRCLPWAIRDFERRGNLMVPPAH